MNARSTDPDISGKKYLPGLTEGSIGAGVLNAPFVAAMVLFGVDWMTPFAGATSAADWIPGVWSPTDVLLQPMGLTLTTTNIAAYQRRRKRGVGI